MSRIAISFFPTFVRSTCGLGAGNLTEPVTVGAGGRLDAGGVIGAVAVGPAVHVPLAVGVAAGAPFAGDFSLSEMRLEATAMPPALTRTARVAPSANRATEGLTTLPPAGLGD